MAQEKEKDTAQPSKQASKKDVTFPGSKRRKKGKKGVLIVIVILIIAAIGAGVWFIFSEPNVEDEAIVSTPTPTLSGSTPIPTQEPVERSEVSIQVLNGTGISGQAGSTQEELEELGYEDIEVGNADDQDYEITSVTFDEEVSQAVRNELLSALEEIFEEVDSDEDDLTDYDVVIITGYPVGHTPTATSAPTATSTPTPTATDSGTTTE